MQEWMVVVVFVVDGSRRTSGLLVVVALVVVLVRSRNGSGNRTRGGSDQKLHTYTYALPPLCEHSVTNGLYVRTYVCTPIYVTQSKPPYLTLYNRTEIGTTITETTVHIETPCDPWD